MRLVDKTLVLALILAAVACSKDSGGGSAPAPAVAAAGGETTTLPTTTVQVAQEPARVGSLAIDGGVSGIILPKEGTGASASGASVSVENHPELSAVTNDKGEFTLPAAAGVLAIYVTANGAALTDAPAAFGLKFADVVVKAGETTDLGQNALKATGSVSGTVTFLGDPSGLELVGTDVYVPGTSFAAKTDEQGHFSLAGLPEGKYNLRFEHTGLSPSKLDGIGVVEGTNTELPGVILSLSGGPEGGLRMTADEQPTIGGNLVGVATSRKVQVVISYDSEATLMKVSDEPSFLDKAWEPVKTSYEWTFPSDGGKSLYVKFSDANGLESSPYSSAIVVDTEAPVLNAVALLNGWSSASTPDVFADLVAADSGTGIAEVMIANESDSFAGSTWRTFAPRLDWSLAAGSGPKRTFFKVRDYVGRESNVLSDGISISSYSEIGSQDYTKKLVLYKEQSPYFVGGNIQIDTDVEIKPGVEVRFGQTATLDIRGVLTAAGTAGEPIVFKPSSALPCSSYPSFILYKAAPGRSEATLIDHVEAHRASFLMGGGTISNSELIGDPGACGGSGAGNIEKHGQDNFALIDNHLVQWERGPSVQNGNHNSKVIGNHGTAAMFLKQTGDATNTEVSGNDITYSASSFEHALIAADAGELDLSGNTFATSDLAIASASLSDARVTGAHFTTCGTVAQNTSYATGAVGTLTIAESRFDSCTYGVSVSAAGGHPIVVEDSNVRVASALAIATTQGTLAATFQRNNLVCDSAGVGLCDLVRHEVETVTATNDGSALADPYLDAVTLSANNINCPAANCRGFVYYTDHGMHPTYARATFALQGNYWSAKQPALAAVAMPIRSTLASAIDVDVRRFEFNDNPASPDLNIDWHLTEAHAGAGPLAAGPH